MVYIIYDVSSFETSRLILDFRLHGLNLKRDKVVEWLAILIEYCHFNEIHHQSSKIKLAQV